MKHLPLLCSLIVFSALGQTTDNQLPIMVKFTSQRDAIQIDQTVSRHLFKDWYVYYPSKANFQTILEILKTDDHVKYVQIAKRNRKHDLSLEDNIITNDRSYAAPIFNDPQLSRQWVMKDTAGYGSSILKAYELFPYQKNDVVVAVVDTGIDYKHEDLKENLWINTDEVPNNGIDDDNNGYKDDIYGINTLVRDANHIPTSDVMDTHSHGTHVAGSIAAVQNNLIGVAGIASNAKIMAIRTVPNNGDELDVDVIESFIYAAKNGAKIINCSFGKAVNEGGLAVSEAIDYIGKEYNVLVIAAAGNDSKDIDKSPTYPASYNNEHLLVVASTSSTGALSYFSNYGKASVDIAAPGSNIYSTVPGNRYESKSGTSMATPNTVGVAAEVLSRFPDLTALELKQTLMNNVDQQNYLANKVMSGGAVNLSKILTTLYR